MNIYKKTPAGIMNVLEWFTRLKLSYILFKCEHIFQGANKNADILFEAGEDYKKAAGILQEHGFIQRYGESFEKYKQMYCRYGAGIMVSIHLHREIAWHGMVALDKKEVFLRKVRVHPLITIPGTEDSVLIHAAHVLFENFRAGEREKHYFSLLQNPGLSHAYIKQQLRLNHWEQGFQRVVRGELSGKSCMLQWREKLLREPAPLLYVLRKGLRIPLRALSLKRKGCLLSLTGVNGSGKSTLSRKVLEAYAPITTHLGMKQQYYYYGWKPSFFLTKLLSRPGSGRFQRSIECIDKNIDKNRDKNMDKKKSIKQELLFLYLWWEFLYRYFMEVLPALRRGNLVVTDRYFYDICGQYPYAARSIILPVLLRLFPKPDRTFVLDTRVEELQQRGKTDKEQAEVRQKERNVFPGEYLEQQRRQYFSLARQFSFPVVDTSRPMGECVDAIIKGSWRKMM